MKKNSILTNSTYSTAVIRKDVLMAIHQENASSPHDSTKHPSLVGIFQFDGQPTACDVSKAHLHDGIYQNLIDGKSYEIREATLYTDGEPIIIQSNCGQEINH